MPNDPFAVLNALIRAEAARGAASPDARRSSGPPQGGRTEVVGADARAASDGNPLPEVSRLSDGNGTA
ncbi:hypothetical protein ABZ070_05545 [Streptomyces sp. NPDC006283]|uniref:hypothetical protein n=1 Tax=Streptomyces sp. NPDC006283 TaxID=3156741 RepID=UPI00339DB425